MRSPVLKSKFKLALATVMVGSAVTPAPAFYFAGWPGSGVTPPAPSILPPVSERFRNPDSRLVPVDRPDPTTIPPGEIEKTSHVHPRDVPEPATLALAGVGLVVVARRVRRR